MDSEQLAARGKAVHAAAREYRDELVDYVCRLARVESPSDDPTTQAPVQEILTRALGELGYRVRKVGGGASGGHLFAAPALRPKGRPAQLLMGHSDTVWPVGTLARMPVEVRDGRLRGPGVFDMKAGLTQMIFALRILRDLELDPPATPVLFINSDEELGSPDSRRRVELVARHVCRAFVIEPSLGPDGHLKTARKGVGNFAVTVRGKAAHAGLDPRGGASAILEMAHVIRYLHGLTDHEAGITVNVGVVGGGLRPNVIAPEAHAQVDVRVLTLDDARKIEATIRAMEPGTPGTSLEIEGGFTAPPLERTPRNRALWQAAREAGSRVGITLQEAVAGGGSDGNTTSLFTATLDGLGAAGDGAHAAHEFLYVDSLVERTALLAELLMVPVPAPGEEGAG
ncbi:MAG: M20/M25/M40 family metallo-hydrolase [Gemmatimonadota bacterium]|nr:M20/M25/M40 family metallo-hydrolase [Gemmatimonadota bacterium]